jgi:hypothetical protein
VAATERAPLVQLRRAARRAERVLRALAARRGGARALPYVAAAQLAGVLAGIIGSPAQAVELPENRADLMFHSYDGGGVRATGPALLVRKSLLDRVSLSGTYYADMVSNASIDVVTNASPFKENRNEYGVGLDYVVRDALVSLSASRSKEPDYIARAVSLDLSQETFGGMTTVALGFTRASDEVGQRDRGFFDSARHWRYRFGVTQILTPRWLASLNFEAVSDEGFLGNPYRSARVFGAAVPERNPRTRSSRAVKFRAVGDIGNGIALRGDYRYFWDNWEIKAHTFELGAARRFGDRWLVDGYGRYTSQDKALFYFDNAASETLYVSRNRQLSTYDTIGLGAKASWTWLRQPGRYEVRVNGAVERTRFDFKDFTDLRSGALYSYEATVLQVFLSATF